MIVKTEFTYKGSNNREALADCYHSGEKKSVVLFCHGFKSFKSWGHFPLFAKEIAKMGYTVILFNFTHNGTTVSSPEDFVDLDAFAENNLEKELNDLSCIIKSLQSSAISTYVDTDNISLIGHSRGGGIALSYALSHLFVKKCITLAGVIDMVQRYGQIEDEHWKTEGVKYIKNGRTNQNMPLNYQLVLNTVENKSLFNFTELLKQDSRKFLVIHGTADEAVSVTESTPLEHINNVEIHFIPEAKHTFGGYHPYEKTELPLHTEKALQKIKSFLKQD